MSTLSSLGYSYFFSHNKYKSTHTHKYVNNNNKKIRKEQEEMIKLPRRGFENNAQRKQIHPYLTLFI